MHIVAQIHTYILGGNATLHVIVVKGCNKICKSTVFYSICLEKPDANIPVFQITKAGNKYQLEAVVLVSSNVKQGKL